MKNSTINTTGVKLSKDRGKRGRDIKAPAPLSIPDVVNSPQFKKYIEILAKEHREHSKRISTIEHKLNNMQVDPITSVVTFPPT